MLRWRSRATATRHRQPAAGDARAAARRDPVRNNLTDIAASTLATGLLLAFFGDAGVIYATLVMTVVIFVVAEVLPKTAAFNMPDRIASSSLGRSIGWCAGSPRS